MHLEEIRDRFENSPFFSHIGFEVVYFHEGDVLLKLPITGSLLNAGSILHGGVHATMLDIVLGMVIQSTTGTRCTTIHLNTNYLAPIADGAIFANAKVLKKGYRTVVAEGEIWDEQEEYLAKGVGTFKLIRET